MGLVATREKGNNVWKIEVRNSRIHLSSIIYENRRICDSHCDGRAEGFTVGSKLMLGGDDGILVGLSLGVALGLALGGTENVPHSTPHEQGQLSMRSKISSSV